MTTTETQAARIAALEAEIARLHAVLERADDMANALVVYFNKRGADHSMRKGNEDIGDLADTLSNYGPLRLVEREAMDKTFTVSKDERTHDESGRGLEMGFYFVCYGSTRLRQRPDNAYARAKRLMAQGWTPADESTRSFVDGMRNVERAFDHILKHTR